MEIPTLVRLLRIPKGRRILEVGCGRGIAFAPLLASLEPASLVGIDVDEEVLAEAERTIVERALAAHVVRADVRRMPFADASFDVVFDFGTCYHVSRPHEALAEIERVLAPNGLFVHETPLAQLVAHPERFRARALPWHSAASFIPARTGLFWSSRAKTGTSPDRSGVSRTRERTPRVDTLSNLCIKSRGLPLKGGSS